MIRARAFERLGRLPVLVAILTSVGIAGSCAAPDKDASPEPVISTLATSNGLALNGLTTNGSVVERPVVERPVVERPVVERPVVERLCGRTACGRTVCGRTACGRTVCGRTACGRTACGRTVIWVERPVVERPHRNRRDPRRDPSQQLVRAPAAPVHLRLRDAGPDHDATGTVVTSSYDTALDPNNGTLACGASGACDFGYACSPQNKCVVPLKGATSASASTPTVRPGAQTGTCDESCQRWVSACVLARTNAYGVHVQISMRAPAVAPLRSRAAVREIQAALSTSPTEVTDFSYREGAYYGNIFATTPVDPTTALPATTRAPTVRPRGRSPARRPSTRARVRTATFRKSPSDSARARATSS